MYSAGYLIQLLNVAIISDTPALTNATIMKLYSLQDRSLYSIGYNAPDRDFNKILIF